MDDYATSGSEIEAMMNDLLMQKYLDGDGDGDSAIDNTAAAPPHNTQHIDKLVFGRTSPVDTSRHDPPPAHISAETPLPAQLTVTGLPSVSRVENQLKLQLKLTFPAGRGNTLAHKDLVHLPADCIAKEKLFLANDDLGQLAPALRRRMLRLDARLVCAGSNAATYVCDRCTQREHRRASRRKSGLSDNMLWCNNPRRSPIIFKNKQVFPVPPGQNTADALSFDLVARIVCYSRHHGADDGFKIVFTVRDVEDESSVIAYAETHPITIVDKKQPGTATATAKSKTASTTTAPPASMAEFFSSSQLFLSTETEGKPAPLTSLAPPFPSPSSLSEDDSTALSASHKRARNSIDSSSSWSNANTNTSVNFSFDALSELYRPAPPPRDDNAPQIQRIIPAQGTINGGIEITLLGRNLKQGQVIKFGDNVALSTQCWNDSTMVTYLPPAANAGQVVVTIEDRAANPHTHMNLGPLIQPKSTALASPGPGAVFTYVDDTDRQLIELALQIVGLKMNGKLEDARNIAKRIVGSNGSTPAGSNHSTPSDTGAGAYNYSAHHDEALLVNVLKSFRVGSRNLNVSVCDTAGRTLLHYAALKGHTALLRTLVAYGADVERRDRFGFTPLHFAAVGGDRDSIDILHRRCGADAARTTGNGADARALLWRNHRVAWGELYGSSAASLHSLSAASSLSSLRDAVGTTYPSSSDNSDDAMQEDEEFADDEGETEEEQEQETHSPDTSLWNRMVTRLNENDLLPKYEDLFPRSLLDVATKSKTRSTAVVAQDSASEDELDYEEDLRTVVQQFFVEQRTKLRNDSMLLFFWLPLMVVLVCAMALYNLGGHGNAIQTAGDGLAKYLRMGLSHVVLGNERMRAAVMSRLQAP
ncbi:hypothetical protein DAKH74_023450 [Maudiozyma humilis]|uniref:IPT/TIG domain-containing protein n=1 Tax=Maudiozyma humilis TaxID=51915 RepID=A0AAV5RZ44_MAUHU|nr:hypothetical protein DAKH74_023450 [Kazachstania humilis]